MNKFTYLYVIQGLYGNTYVDLTQSESYKEIKIDLKAYRNNENGSFRIIKRRILNS
jgi:hypothetical protein